MIYLLNFKTKVKPIRLPILFLLITFVFSISACALSIVQNENTSGTPSVLPNTLPLPPTQPAQTSTLTSHTNEYYVALNGSDQNPGSFDHPWRTIQFAVDQASAGDEILILGGTYHESIQIDHSGDEEKPVLLKNFSDQSVFIQSEDLPAISIEADFWVIEGLTLSSIAEYTLELHSSNNKISNNIINGAVYLWGNHNLFENNEIDGSQHSGNENGFMDDGSSSHHNIIRNNKIHDFLYRGIWTQWFTHDNLIENNLVFNINSEKGICIDLDGASNVEYRHIVRANTVHDCGQTGIELENAYATLVENNIIYNIGLEAIQVISYQGCDVAGEELQYGDPDGDCRGDKLDTILQQNLIVNGGRVGGIVSYASAGVKVYNNVIYNGTSTALFLKNDLTFSNNWDVCGNIFANNKRTEISLVEPASLSIDQNNLIFHPDHNQAYEVRNSTSKFYNLSDWLNNFSLGTGSVEADPLFINPGTWDFQLSPSSPGVDTGCDSGIPFDFSGNSRPQGLTYDMGIFELQSSN